MDNDHIDLENEAGISIIGGGQRDPGPAGRARKAAVRITRYLKPELIRLGMMNGHAEDMDPEKDPQRERQRLKEEALDELADLFMLTGRIRNRSKFLHDLISRERKATTALGGGLAVPHVRSMQPRQFCMVFARSRDGIEFASPDGEPVHVIFGIAAPSYDENVTNDYLQAYKWIARCFKEVEWLSSSLLQARDEHEIIAILSGLD
ncbi:MAG: PTS sugar transporter subunit IIA [Planctomycetota bacterium]|jgi:mannitol/fructose-specific phosphotransferase system IIA component (Ntr-type)|nr:PTS sugar transporter subunit IIA [Planctomycetota bacterium]